MKDRGISPTQGAILMVAIVLILSVSTWYLLQGLIDFERPAPNVGFAAEQNDIPPGTKITHVFGDDLESSNVEIKGGVMLTDTGNEWTAGENTTIYPTQDEILIIWNNGVDSAILYKQDALLPPITYEIDKSGSVDSGDFDDEENILEGGARSRNGNLVTPTDQILYSRVNASGNVKIEENNTVYRGAVSQNGEVNVQPDSKLYGRVSAAGDVGTNNNVTVRGVVVARSDSGDDPNVNIGQDNEITGYVRGAGNDSDIDIGSGTTIDGNVSSSGQIDINSGIVITDGVEADKVTIDSDVRITGGVDTDNLSCGSNVTIDGEPCTA